MTSPTPLEVYPIAGMPEVLPGDDLAAHIVTALERSDLRPRDGDVLVVAQKVVSKAENARVDLKTVEPTPFARQWAETWERDPRAVELVLRESKRIVRMARGLIVSETHHGFVCANAGLDQSNTGRSEVALLLPRDPDKSARGLRESVRKAFGVDVAVIVADTFGRPWRVGLTQVALGVAGLVPVEDFIDKLDNDGRRLHMTTIAQADQLACAADLVCGKLKRVPAALIRNYDGPRGEGSGQELLRDPNLDLFR
ncbi:MAG TPA: coenzyme F420-0:L-glutamate ligase [bacterium]